MRKLFKGGNNSRAETIHGNTVAARRVRQMKQHYDFWPKFGNFAHSAASTGGLLAQELSIGCSRKQRKEEP